MSIYPKYKARRDLFMADDLGPEAVEIATDKGIKGIGYGGPGCSFVIEKHLTKLLMGEDPFDVERLWDIMWRSTMYYGRKGLVVHAISAVDLALWDIIGNALGMPVYKLLGGETKSRIPAYCTGNDIEQHLEFGYKRVKLAVPYGPADGREGMKKNVELVKKTREPLGPDGDIMLDCWMALTEDYTIEFAEMVEPYRVYWMEECLPPDDYDGFGRLHARIKSTQMATGEHEYTRYGFRLLLEHKAARHLAARYELVRGAQRDASYWRAGRRLQYSRYSPRRMETRLPALYSGHYQQPLVRNVYASAGRSAGSLPAVRGGKQHYAGTRGHLHEALGSPRLWMGIDCRLINGVPLPAPKARCAYQDDVGPRMSPFTLFVVAAHSNCFRKSSSCCRRSAISCSQALDLSLQPRDPLFNLTACRSNWVAPPAGAIHSSTSPASKCA